ncbi:kinase domain-containing protein [Lineolata rhizophorae]|uniref:non-specific serine/threonine protein kinase n=1 Tax=Lineolata rhizophorae TaxID=578093 RepID=A0A6A6P296_9PEZI|nr:kinase domain-containing protein [Lineolata rhizophorae]
MANDTSQPPQAVYIPEIDLEDFEDYTIGGYHPIVIGDTFQHGRYHVVHKLGFGGYSTIWLADDKKSERYVSLKVLVAGESSKSTEGEILRLLHSVDSMHPGQRFIPRLLDEFSFEGPNGRHTCLVREAAGCSIAASKEDSVNFMFPIETARSIAAQLIMGVSNFLLRGPDLDKLSPDELYKRYRLDKVPVTRIDGAAVEPHAPPYAVYPMHINMAADKLVDPIVTISDYGTSFILPTNCSPELHTPPLFLPPEDFFHEPITLAADIWTLGVNLYGILGERPLFETLSGDRDDIFADTISTLGRPPARWWDSWGNRKEFFEPDGSWIRNVKRIYTPVFRPLHQRMWDMGRGKTTETCEWDVEGGEMQALEELLRAMLAFEPAERPTAKQLMASEYMVKWAMPAWQRQLGRAKDVETGSSDS